MNVPLRQEVVQSRARVELAARADRVVQAARWDLAVLGGHLTRLSMGGQVHEVPGDHTLSLAAEIWPDSMRPVLDVVSAQPHIEERLKTRQRQLQMTMQIYSGTASALELWSVELTAVVQRQSDLLQKVENWELLRQVMMRRQAVAVFSVQALPLNPQQIDLAMITSVFAAHIPLLSELRTIVDDSVDVFVLHARLARMISSMHDQLVNVNLWPAVGVEPPDRPSELVGALLAIDDLFELCLDLSRRATEALNDVREQLTQINAERDEASVWLRETLG